VGYRRRSRMLLTVAALAVVALLGVVIFVPWSVSSGCYPNDICEPPSAVSLGKIGAIVVLGAIAFFFLILGLNPD
jgi:hypothetical protein